MIKKKLTAAVLSSLAAMSFTGSALAAEQAPELNEFTLDTLIVTASRIPSTITDAKADVSVVTREHIEDMHMENVDEALRTVPGVQFLNYGTNGMNANLSGIRINGSKDIVILVDGVRVTDFQGSGSSGYAYTALMSNMDNIERIEVLRGSAATVYGSGAKGGVINIITRKINDNQASINIARGSFGKENYKFHNQGRRGKFSYSTYYDKTLVGDIEDGAGKTWEGSTNTKSNGIKLAYDFNDQHKLSISYDKLKSEYSGLDGVYDAHHYDGLYDSKNLTIKYDTQFSEKWSNALTYRKNDVETFYNKISEGLENHSDYSYYFLSDQVTLDTSRHTVVFGFDYSKGSGYNVQAASNVKKNRTMKNYSYYVQDDWEIIPDVTLSGGIRYDRPERGEGPELDTHTSKSYKLSWDITDKDTIYAGRSDFYILPSIDQMYNTQWDNAKLSPAEGRTTSIGYNKTFDDNNILTVNWFETKSDKIIGFDSEGQYQNYDDGVSRGWNAQYMTQLSDRWSATLGWSHLFYHANGDNYEMGYYPKDMATFSIQYDYAKFNAGLDGFYFMRKVNDKYADKQGWPADNYAVVNLSLNYKPTDNLTFYTKVDNLFDKLYAEHTNVIHGGEPGSWYSMPGRSFVVGMELKF